MSHNLQKAFDLIKAGKTQEAYQCLSALLKTNPNNDQAWLLLSVLVTNDKRRECIENALRINPNSKHAQEALAQLESSKIIR